MKQMILSTVALLIATATMAQSTTATVAYQKINRQAVVNEMPFPEKTVRNAVEDKMQKLGYKGKEVKGYTVYQGVRLPELGPDSYDLYFMADRKSRKEKESAVLTMLISKGYDNFVADSTDATVMNNAKTYLNNIKEMIAAYDLEQQIMTQEDVIKKADKKYTGLIDDGESLEKKRRNIEKDIEDNKKNQEAQKTEIEKQRQILETLRSKRKS